MKESIYFNSPTFKQKLKNLMMINKRDHQN
jgi:hypothetical protein